MQKSGIGTLRKATALAAISAACALCAGMFANADNFDQRISEITRIDPALITHKQTREIATGLRHARGIAVDRQGLVYVVGDKSLRVFDAHGKTVRASGLPAAPYSVHISRKGTLYIGLENRVLVGAGNGSFTKWPALPGKPRITSISSSADAIWVADAGQRVVWKLDMTGQVNDQFGKRGAAGNAPWLVVPSPHLDIVAAKDGVWIANPGRQKVELYGLDGRIKRSWGRASLATDGFNGCCNPADFAILPDGRFVTSEKTIQRVKIYSAAGKFESVVAGPYAFARRAGSAKPAGGSSGVGSGAGMDVAVDGQGRIYVLAPESSVVRVFVSKAPTPASARNGGGGK